PASGGAPGDPAMVAPPAAPGQAAQHRAPGAGDRHVRRRDALCRLEGGTPHRAADQGHAAARKVPAARGAGSRLAAVARAPARARPGPGPDPRATRRARAERLTFGDGTP